MNPGEVYVDFDGTLLDNPSLWEIMDVEPNKKLVAFIRKAYAAGLFVGIYSCRANEAICDPIRVTQMVEYLKKYDIPYTAIVPNKPHFRIIIDDRAVRPDEVELAERIMFGGAD
jgi:hypothetical protein